MSSGIFMEYGDLVIQFPVNPPEVRIKVDGNNETIEVVKLGEINIAKGVKLATTSFESFLPSSNKYPFIRTKSDFKGPEFYLDFINKVRLEKKPVRFIVSETNINMLTLIDSFEYGYMAADEDVHFNITLTEYRELRVKEVKITDYKSDRPQKKPEPSRPQTVNKQVTPGCDVIVNGRLHRDSYGSGPGKTLSNYNGKVNFVENSRSYPYHVTNTSGGWMGWVTKDSVRVK